MEVYLEMSSKRGGKFWKLVQRGKKFTTTFGNVGSDGRESTPKIFTTTAQCIEAAKKLIESKKKKGYAEVDGDDGDMDQDEDEDEASPSPPPKKRGRKRRTPDSPSSSPPRKRRKKQESDDDEEDPPELDRETRLENEDTNQFWEISVSKNTYRIRTGALGKRGRLGKANKFKSAKQARIEAHRAYENKKEEWDMNSEEDEDKEADEDEDEEDENVFEGLVFTCTGALTKGRKETQELIEDNGGTFKQTVTNDCDYVVVKNANCSFASAKMQTAIAKKVKIVIEDFLYDSLNDGALADEEDYIVNPKKAKKKTTSKGSSGSKKSKPSSKATSSSPSSSKQKKMVVKGRCAVDDAISGHERFHVYEEPNCVWDAMLNQTNLNNNNNKFYKLQVLETDKGGQYYVWFRWGRVGYAGQNKMMGPFKDPEKPKQEFRKKFSAKTMNNWADRDDFEYQGKYTYLPMDYGANNDDDGKDKEEDDDDDNDDDSGYPDSTLSKQVQDLVQLIFDKDMFEEQMKEIGFDCKKLPLGKVTKKVIQQAYEVLKEIGQVIEGNSNKNLSQLSSRYYTLIPHEFGMKRPPAINTSKMLKRELELVESLGQIEVAEKLLKGGKARDRHPCDEHFDKLKSEIEALSPDDEEFQMCAEYTQRTHAKTHNSYTLEVQEVFKINRAGSDDIFKPYEDDHNRMLLWHGSRLTNFVGIISQGLRIAPPEAPVTGYMFGKGVYFADMCSKSANYCRTSAANPTGLMLLCEVALGDMSEKLQADYYAGNLPPGKLSTKGVGKTCPNPASYTTLDNGCVVPIGDGVQNPDLHQNSSLLYNEYIVYNTAQIKMRYLLKMNFKHKAGWGW